MYHRILIVGNLGRDPELRYVPSGQAVTSLNIATNRQYTDSNGQQVKETTWFRVSVWGRQAEACNQYLRKGSAVLVEGTLTPDLNTGGPRIWTRQDGTPGANFEVRAVQVKFLPGRTEEPGGYPQTDIGTGEAGGENDEDIPF
jgi:single-strand DNA-binding protein